MGCRRMEAALVHVSITPLICEVVIVKTFLRLQGPVPPRLFAHQLKAALVIQNVLHGSWLQILTSTTLHREGSKRPTGLRYLPKAFRPEATFYLKLTTTVISVM